MAGASVEKNAADEKTREHEKEIDTAPSDGEGAQNVPEPKTEMGISTAEKMEGNDDTDGQAANAVKLRNPFAQLEPGLRRLGVHVHHSKSFAVYILASPPQYLTFVPTISKNPQGPPF